MKGPRRYQKGTGWSNTSAAVLCTMVGMACAMAMGVLSRVAWAEQSGFLRFSEKAIAPKTGVVVKVLDGDTVVLKEGFTVRYLGVDAPEMDHTSRRHDCYALQAYERNRAMVLGRSVRLSYDRHLRDDYGRLLAYVTTADGLFVNAQLIREGLAYVFRGSEGFSKFDEFVALQRQAVRERRGLHGQCAVREETFYLGNTRSFIFHRPACAYGAKVHLRHRLEFATRWQALEKGFRPCRRCQP